MIENTIGPIAYKKVGKKNQPFASVKCPICGNIENRRIRKDSSGNCRSCSLALIRSKKELPSTGLQGETSKNHPLNRLYRIWRGMIRRCYEPNAMGYNIYGAKGITVCNEWRYSFASFKEWSLLNGYTDELVIDKDELCELHNISPKRYSPETCIWTTASENSKTNCKIPENLLPKMALDLENGKTTPQFLADTYGVKPSTILVRTRPFRTKKYVNKSKL